jgi:membrane-associated phospholipid phosphatase
VAHILKNSSIILDVDFQPRSRHNWLLLFFKAWSKIKVARTRRNMTNSLILGNSKIGLYLTLFILFYFVFSGCLLGASHLRTQIAPNGTAQLSDSTSNSAHNPFIGKALPYAILTVAGGLLFTMDTDINRQFYNNRYRSHTVDQLSNVFNQYGMGGSYLITVPLLAGHGFIFKNKKSIYVAGELIGGGLLAGGFTEGIKIIFGRERPYQTSTPSRFFKGGSSFYSGHAVMAFTFATVISQNYPSQDLNFIGIHWRAPLLPVLTYSAGGLVCLQRLYSHNHWASDVYYGALAGYGAGSLAVYLGNRKRFSHLTVGLDKPGFIRVCYSFN